VVYSDGTPNRTYLYDVNSAWQTTTANNLKGRLAVTGVSGSGSANWNGSLFSYDAVGRVVGLWACHPSTCSILPSAHDDETIGRSFALSQQRISVMPNLGWRNVFPVPNHYDTARSISASHRPYYLRKDAPGGGPREGWTMQAERGPFKPFF
jgi:hypothetical protein